MQVNSVTHPGLAKDDTLFIHGNLGSRAWWTPTLTEWRRQGPCGDKSLIFTDWRGCGANPDWPIDAPFTLEDLARDLLETHPQKQLALVGHSLGGLIALQMMILAPERVSRAVLLDPVGAKGVVFDDSMYAALRQMASNEDLTRTVILSTIAHAETVAPELARQLGTDAFKAVRGIGTAVLRVLKTVDLRAAVGAIQTPTLILHGQNDAIIPLADSEELARLHPNARLEVLPQAGHCWNVEDPRAFTTRLRAWL